MGYLSHIRGQLDIEPDLAPRRVRFRDGGLLCGRLAERDIEAEIDGETENVQVSRLVGVEPAWEDPVKARDLRGELDEIIGQIPEGHALRGILIREGENQGDVERFIVDGHGVRSEKARLLWPDGSEVAR